MIGKLLDRRYKVTQSLSQGAFGCTFLAKDTKRPGNPICVIKQFKPKQSDPGFLVKAKELFEREAEVLEFLGKHPHIPCLLAHLEIEQEFYLVQEYIAGKTLVEELADEQKSESEVVEIISELLEIVAFIHSQQIIHRDIKPSNIIRSKQNNRLFLIDFGAAMEFEGETLLGTIIGTPGYIPQEQLSGKTGFYSDIYAIGIVGVQALTQTAPNLLNRDENDEIIWQDQVNINRDFKAILAKMVRENKSDRYTTAKEVLKDLSRINHSPSLVKTPPSFTNEIDDNQTKAKFIVPILLAIAIVPLFLWFNKLFSGSSNTNLPLNGKVINEELSATDFCLDTILEQDIYCKKYTFNAEKDREIIVDMNSDDFDPFLILQAPDGSKLEQNGDRSSINWNAQIRAKLPSDGQYTVITRTTSPGESGNYTVRARINKD